MRVIRTIVNDIYYSLIPLYYPPSLLAYTALYMSSVYDQKNITFIFGANDIDMNDIYEASSKIISFYKSFPSLHKKSQQIESLIQRINKLTYSSVVLDSNKATTKT